MSEGLASRSNRIFYDDSGYYSYVLLNGSAIDFQLAQTFLANKYKILHWGKSYRPASNGLQYDWFMRISDSAGKHPPRDTVEKDLEYCGLRPEEVALISQGLEEDKQKVQEELHSYVNNFEPEIDERNQMISDLKRELVERKNEIGILKEENRALLQHQNARAMTEPVKESPQYLFQQILELLLPQVQFLGGAIGTLWHEIRNPLAVLEKLTDLGRLEAKRVHKAPDWLERHVEGDWRLYFRKNENAKYQVLISHKNTQEADIKWLNCQ
jgi:signal transduction histidine kinase